MKRYKVGEERVVRYEVKDRGGKPVRVGDIVRSGFITGFIVETKNGLALRHKISKGFHTFRNLHQISLEVVGSVDKTPEKLYAVGEDGNFIACLTCGERFMIQVDTEEGTIWNCVNDHGVIRNDHR